MVRSQDRIEETLRREFVRITAAHSPARTLARRCSADWDEVGMDVCALAREWSENHGKQFRRT